MDRATCPSERFFVAARVSCSSRAEEIGEDADDPAVAGLRDPIAGLAAQFGGRVIVNFGQEVVCVFTELLTAVDATKSMHKRIVNRPSGGGAYLRLGLFEPADDTLREDTWAAAIAKTRQLARLALAGHILACVREVDLIDRASRCEEHEVDLGDWYEDDGLGRAPAQRILWQDESPTRLAIGGSGAVPATRVERLLLRWRDKKLVLDKNSRSVTIGRHGSSDVAIDSDFASRNHARLEYVHSCFVLADCSTNGTFVKMDENEFYLHDDELILRGKGSISLGRGPSSSRGKLIYFTTEAVPFDEAKRESQ